MPKPFFHQGFSCASQQGPLKLATTMGRRAPGALLERAAIVLLGIVLLCGAAAVREFEISIRDRRVEGGASTIRVKRGETVLLRWRTDEAVSLHVHGYDLHADVVPASPESMRFEAKVAGRFPIAAHQFGATADQHASSNNHREVTLLYLEVLPE
jgi:hypothetical protein